MAGLRIETQIFGSIETYLWLSTCDKIYLEKQETYQKRSYRNRYVIISSAGKMSLSIPLVSGKNQSQLITDVKISYDENWVRDHIRSLRTCYQSAPFYEHYIEEIESLFYSHRLHLWDLNVSSIRWCLQVLGLSVEVVLTEEFRHTYHDQIDYRDKIHPKKRPTITDYHYPQVFEDRLGFIPGASILDLIFNLGPSSKSWLQMEMKKNS